MDTKFQERVPENVAISIYRQRGAKELELTFAEFLKNRNWKLEVEQKESVQK